MRIDGMGSPGLPLAPISGAGAAGSAQPFNASANAAALALQQQEQKGGGGGGGHGGHGGVKRTAMDSIDEIAARASVNIESRKKTVLDRMADIEKMKAELANAEDEEDAAGEDLAEDREKRKASDVLNQSMTA